MSSRDSSSSGKVGQAHIKDEIQLTTSVPVADDDYLRRKSDTELFNVGDTDFVPKRSAIPDGLPLRSIGSKGERRSSLEETYRRRKLSRELSKGSVRYEAMNYADMLASDPVERQLTVEFKALSNLVTEVQHNETAGLETVKNPTAQHFMETEYHLLTVDEILKILNSSRDGLSTREVTELQKTSKNLITPPRPDVWKKIFGYLFGGFCSLMWISSLVCWLAWKPLGNPNPDVTNLGVAIVLMVIIVLQAGFTAYQDWSAGKVMASINNMVPQDALVIRDGQKKTTPASGLVVGDILCLTLGDKVAADVRLTVVSSDLTFDKSILTGEGEPIQGTVQSTDPNYLESKNIAMMGTYVTNGSGLGVVVAIGNETVMGRIANLSSRRREEKTLLQIEISRFVKYIAAFSIGCAIATLIIWALWLQNSFPGFLDLTQALVQAIAVLVAFTPVGLPISVTVTLTVIARQMYTNMVLCKNLTTIDTLGGISVLASDKTGTLTQNKMFVTNIGLSTGPMAVANVRSELNSSTVEMFRSLRLIAGLCNNAAFNGEDLDLPVSERRINGDATDCALLNFAETFDSVAKDQERFRVLFEVPFNSKKKYMYKLLKVVTAYGSYTPDVSVVFVKGGPDVLLGMCSSILGPEGRTVPLSGDEKDKLLSVRDKWSSQGQRCIIFAQKTFTEAQLPVDYIEPWAMEDMMSPKLKDLTIVGLVGIVDPPRPEIPEVVETCRLAGIRIFMVTGDFQLTATAIAKQIGIITQDTVDEFSSMSEPGYVSPVFEPNGTPRALVLSGNDLRAMNDSQWDIICEYQEVVFARTTPEQKLKIVAEFRQRKNVVGVTGDGVNDAPALKAANVGIAMGGGSDVAMEASDMIFLNNNFSSIIVAIQSGRLVFDNIKKVIAYLLPAGLFAEVTPLLLNILLGIPMLMSPFEMICICLLTDICPSMSLLYENPEADIMKRPPRDSKKDRLVDWKLVLHVTLYMGLMETLCAAGMFFYYLNSTYGLRFGDVVLAYNGWTDGFHGYTADQLDEGLKTGQSVYFVTLVLAQWGNLFCTRTRRLSVFQQNPLWGPNRNLWLFGAMAISAGIVVILLEVPFFNDIFDTRPIPWRHWLIPIALAVGILCVEETRKAIVRWRPDGLLGKVAW